MSYLCQFSILQNSTELAHCNDVAEWANICRMPNNCLFNTARYLADMFSKYLKDIFFANL